MSLINKEILPSQHKLTIQKDESLKKLLKKILKVLGTLYVSILLTSSFCMPY